MSKKLEYRAALVGFIGALITMVLLNFLSKYALTFQIPQFLIGWISCVVYFALREGVKDDI